MARLQGLERGIGRALRLLFGVFQLIGIIGHIVNTIVTIKAMLHGTKCGSSSTAAAHTAEGGQDTKQDFKPIRRVLTDLGRSNKEEYVIDTFEMNLVITEIRSQGLNKSDGNFRAIRNVENEMLGNITDVNTRPYTILGNIGGATEELPNAIDYRSLVELS